MVGERGDRGDEAGGPTGGVGGAGGGGGGAGGFNTAVICESCPGLVWICGEGIELQSQEQRVLWQQLQKVFILTISQKGAQMTKNPKFNQISFLL